MKPLPKLVLDFLEIALVQARVLWIGLVAPVALCHLAQSSIGVSIISGILQTAGTGVVVIGLMGRRALFGEATLPSILADWVDRLASVHMKPPAQHATAMAASAGALALTASARGRVRSSDLAERVAQLEGELDQLWSALDSSKQELREQINDAERRLARRASEIEESVLAVKNLMRNLNVGSVVSELIGLGWIVVGQAATSFPSLLGLHAGGTFP